MAHTSPTVTIRVAVSAQRYVLVLDIVYSVLLFSASTVEFINMFYYYDLYYISNHGHFLGATFKENVH